MIPIPFTQHLMPDGRTISVTFEADQGTTAEAWIAIRRGVTFYVSRATTDEVLLTATIKGQFALQESYHGDPEAAAAVKRLVHRAYEAVTAPTDGGGLPKEEKDAGP